MDHNDGRGNTKSRSARRGSVDNASRLEAFQNRGMRGNADWGGCNAELIQQVILGITELGGAVTFGLSRDQGAHSLTLLLDQSRETLWFNGDSDLSAELDKVIVTIKAIT